MKMKMVLLAMLLVLLWSVGCSTPPDEWIVGEWEWTGTSDSFDGPRESVREGGAVWTFDFAGDGSFTTYTGLPEVGEARGTGQWTYGEAEAWMLTIAVGGSGGFAAGGEMMLLRHGDEAYNVDGDGSPAQGQSWGWFERK